MLASKGARKALARALSQVVLSRETILVHAESVLERAELIEGSLYSSAFNLWFAVLQRAEAEGAVQRLVASVLEDNPGADPLRQALHEWELAAASVAARDERPLELLEAGPPSSTAATFGQKRSEGARWVVLAALGLSFVTLFTVRALRAPAEPGGQAGRASALPVPGSAPLPVVVTPGATVPAPGASRARPASPVQVGAALRARIPPSEEVLPNGDAGE
jgi:hypothetical protein